MFAGNIGEAQDFPTILSAAEITKKDPNIRWLIVGDGRMAGWVNREIEARGLQNSVLMLGRHPVEMMPSFFKCADVLLLSLKAESIFSMTIPGKLQSYLAAGKPIISMIDGEAARVTRESGAGIVCPAGDAMALAQAVLNMSVMSLYNLQNMGKSGLDYSNREFNRTKLIEKLEKILCEAKIDDINDLEKGF
jgi:glycosyltransferase involved in cell wall biosynthesis